MTEGDFFTFLSPFDSAQRTFSLYWNHLLLFTQLTLLVTIQQIILALAMRTTYGDAEEVSESMPPLDAFYLVTEIVLSYLITIRAQAAIIHVVSEIYMERSPTFRKSLTMAGGRFCAILGFGLLCSTGFSFFFAAVVISVMMLALNEVYFVAALIGIVAITFALYVAISLSVALPILVVENLSPFGAIKRSFELVPGYRCYVFCSSFLLTVVALGGSILYQGLIGKILGDSILATILKGLSSLVSVPLQTMYVYVVHNVIVPRFYCCFLLTNA